MSKSAGMRVHAILPQTPVVKWEDRGLTLASAHISRLPSATPVPHLEPHWLFGLFHRHF